MTRTTIRLSLFPLPPAHDRAHVADEAGMAPEEIEGRPRAPGPPPLEPTARSRPCLV
jgi:hypothetical protein